jgi:DNA-directed RNA polymerase subunit E'/Rpb7
MDPLFERRQLVRNVHVNAKNLQRNIDASLLAQIRMKYEGVCVAEGYVHRGSTTIIEHSLGRADLIKGGANYSVVFQADVCYPHPGQKFKAPVSLKSKIGLHIDMSPMKVLLPRDLHIGDPVFDDVDEKQEVEFEIVGSKFQQGDESIVVLGKFIGPVMPALSNPDEPVPEPSEPLIAAPAGTAAAGSGSEEVRRVTVANPGATKAPGEAPRKKRVRLNPAAKTTNEPPA